MKENGKHRLMKAKCLRSPTPYGLSLPQELEKVMETLEYYFNPN